MAFTLVLYLLPISGFSQISRTQMVTTAESYLDFLWTPNSNCVEQKETAERPTNSSNSRRVNFYRDEGYSGREQEGMVYGWGCWSDFQTFTDRIVIGDEVDTGELDCSSPISGTGSMTYDILMGSQNRYEINLTNTGDNLIGMSLTEKYSDKHVIDFINVYPGDDFLSGTSGGGYTQTLVLEITPFNLGDPIAWTATTSCWGRPANQDRYSCGAYSAHWPPVKENPDKWAVGIDCSGLITRAWNLSWKHSTNNLFQNFDSVILPQLDQGDILVKPGVHVVLVTSIDVLSGLVSYIHSCGDGVQRVVNVDFYSEFFQNGYAMRSYFVQPEGVDQDINLDNLWAAEE